MKQRPDLKLVQRGRVVVALLSIAGCAAPAPAKDPAAANASQAPTTVTDTTNQTSATPAAPPADEGSIARGYGWVSVAIGAQAAVVAIATSFIMLHENGLRSDGCNEQKVCSGTGLDANGKLDALAPWNAGAWAVAVVGVGVGAYLVLSNPPGSSKQTAVGVGPNGSGMGLNLRSRF